VTALAASGAALSACAASAGDLAKASCAHVNSSIALLHQASRTTDAAEAATLDERAYIQLLQAIPIAAQAAYHDIQWQSLATTLSEANRVPESTLLPALQAQCHNADTSVFGQLPPPSSPGGTGG
jgi:hypothetical protein